MKYSAPSVIPTKARLAELRTKRAGIQSFTLVELLIVIAILAVLAAAVVLVLNPAELLAQARDAERASDIAAIDKAVKMFELDNPITSQGDPNTLYTSLPDANSGCSSYALPTLPSGWQYHCVPVATLRNVDGTGWVPLNLGLIKGGSIIPSLPVDPKNNETFFYSYVPGGSWELNAVAESVKNYAVASGDGGDDGYLFEKGSDIKLAPYVNRGLPLRVVDPASVKIVVVDYQNCGQNVIGQLSRTGFTDVVDISATAVSWSDVAAYSPDVVIASQGCWGVSKGALLNDLYDRGYAIFSQGNDSTTTIRPIFTDIGISSGTASGTITKEGSHPTHENWTTTNNSGSDSRRGITAVRPGGVTVAKDGTLGYSEIIYLQEPNKGRWFHIQPSLVPNDILFTNALMYLAR